MSDRTFVSIEDDGPVRTLTMSNPGRRNAVPASGWDELAAAFDRFEASEQRVLVLRGDGEDFCAGADLIDVSGTDFSSAADNLALMGRTSTPAVMATMPRRPKRRMAVTISYLPDTTASFTPVPCIQRCATYVTQAVPFAAWHSSRRAFSSVRRIRPSSMTCPGASGSVRR